MRSSARVRQPASAARLQPQAQARRGTRPPSTRPLTTVSRPRRRTRTRTAARTASRSVTVAPRWTSRSRRDGPIARERRQPPVAARAHAGDRAPAGRRSRSSIRTGVRASGRPRRSVSRPRIRTRAGQVTVVRRRRRRPRSSHAVRRARGWRRAGRRAGGRRCGARHEPARRRRDAHRPAPVRGGDHRAQTLPRVARAERVGARDRAADLAAARVVAALPAVLVGRRPRR